VTLNQFESALQNPNPSLQRANGLNYDACGVPASVILVGLEVDRRY
jgi:hypothetical protein